MAHGKKKDEADEIRLLAVLREVLPWLMGALMRYAGTPFQKVLADKTGVTENQISRYVNKKAFPFKNLLVMIEKLGLHPDSGWWLLGQALTEHFSYARFEVPKGLPEEVREPHSPYPAAPRAEPELPESTARIMALDLDRLPAEKRIRFAQERKALHDKALAQRTLEENYVIRYREALQRRSGS